MLVEVNSETDFVAKDENFLAFTEVVANAALNSDAADAEALKSVKLDSGETIEERRAAVIAKVGENLQVRRLVRIDSANNVAAYVHGGRIGVLVELKGGDIELARGIAMHIAAMNPPHVKASDVPAEFVARKRKSNWPRCLRRTRPSRPISWKKIISGKISKIVNEVTLYGQPYVLNTDQTVEQAVKAAGAEVIRFQRLAVGEGIEKGGGRLRRRSDEAGRPGLIFTTQKKPRHAAAFYLHATHPQRVANLKRTHPPPAQAAATLQMRSALPLLHDGDQAFGVYRARFFTARRFYRAAMAQHGAPHPTTAAVCLRSLSAMTQCNQISRPPCITAATCHRRPALRCASSNLRRTRTWT